LSTDFSLSITEIDNHGRRSRYPADAQVHPQPSACPETNGRVRLSFSFFYRFFDVSVDLGWMECDVDIFLFDGNTVKIARGGFFLYHRGIITKTIHQTNNPL